MASVLSNTTMAMCVPPPVMVRISSSFFLSATTCFYHLTLLSLKVKSAFLVKSYWLDWALQPIKWPPSLLYYWSNVFNWLELCTARSEPLYPVPIYRAWPVLTLELFWVQTLNWARGLCGAIRWIWQKLYSSRIVDCAFKATAGEKYGTALMNHC